MIREATEQDVSDIVRMSCEFYATTGYRSMAPMDPDSVADLTRGLIDSGVMLVAEQNGCLVGMVGLAIASFLFNTEYRVAYEVVWYVSPKHRGGTVGMRLLTEMEKRCAEKGVSAIQMVVLRNSPDVASRMYERFGYERSETCFNKEL